MYRVTVSRCTPTNRAVFRVPAPSATWANTEATVPADNRVPYRGVPLRSENRALHVEHRSTRVLLGPYQAGTVKFPCPRFPWSGQPAFRQQKRLRSSMTDTNTCEEKHHRTA